MAIYEQLKQLAKDEGWETMVREARKIQSSLETIMETGSEEEKVHAVSLLTAVNLALVCQHEYHFDRGCGAKVCEFCGDHKGLARCYCGWSKTSPGEGRKELIDMGEKIDPED